MENNFNQNYSSQDNRFNSSEDYLERAASAVSSGDVTLGIHLYLAAFERALHENLVPSNQALEGMEQAWRLAITSKQRSLAEYILEKTEQFLSPQEVAARAMTLQDMAMDKLEEFGFPREAIENAADMVGQDLLGQSPEVLARFEESKEVTPNQTASEQPSAVQEAQDEAQALARQFEEELESRGDAFAAMSEALSQLDIPSIVLPAKKKKTEEQSTPAPRINFKTIHGFKKAIEDMGRLGVGKANDPEFQAFVHMLNERHGMSRMPNLGTLVFECPAREDANYFMVAAVGELGLPAVRMRLDQNPQGQPVLVVMASPDFRAKISNVARTGFDFPSVLILEDFDLWDLPVDFNTDDSAFMTQSLSRGAREALAIIQAALESPEVTVFISAANPNDIEPYFINMMLDSRLLTMDFPDEEERKDCWRSAQAKHPSMRGLDVPLMVRLSRGLSRFELYAITTELVENAYRESLEAQEFRAVGTDKVLARLSNFQPLDSIEYHEIEDLLIEHFSEELTDIDDLLRDDSWR